MLRILIVDDSGDAAESLATLLKLEGFEVLTAYSASAATKQILERQPDLIICDHIMPGVTGHDLCSQIRRRAETRGIPIIVWTASSVEGWNRDIYDHALCKSSHPDEMIKTVLSLLAPAISANRESSLLPRPEVAATPV